MTVLDFQFDLFEFTHTLMISKSISFVKLQMNVSPMAKILRKALDELNSRSFTDKDLISIIEQTSEKLRKEFLPVQYILYERIDSRSEWEEEAFRRKLYHFLTETYPKNLTK